MEQQKDSRLNFLKAGLLVGGAVYADPASALARHGGRFVGPDTSKFLISPKTPLSKLIPGSYLPGNTGELTLGDLSAMADLDQCTLEHIAKQFSAVTFGDLGDVVSYVVEKMGSTTTIFQTVSGEDGISCCTSCSCTIDQFFPWLKNC